MKFLTFIELRDIPAKSAEKRPFKNILWKPDLFFTQSEHLAYLHLLWAQVIPAFFFDLILKLKGQKAM